MITLNFLQGVKSLSPIVKIKFKFKFSKHINSFLNVMEINFLGLCFIKTVVLDVTFIMQQFLKGSKLYKMLTHHITSY